MNERALIVEDSHAVAWDLGAILQRLGCSVAFASGPEAAIAAARNQRPAIAFVDIDLRGGYEGIEVARQISQETGTRIVFVTGYSAGDLHRRIQGCGRAVVTFKPFDLGSIAATLHAIRQADRDTSDSAAEHANAARPTP